MRANVVFLVVEHRTDSALGLLWAAPIGSGTDAPGLRLSVEVINIGEGACGEERLPDEPYSSFHSGLFFVAARNRYRARLVTIVSGEAQERRMEADRVATSFEHHTLQIVVE